MVLNFLKKLAPIILENRQMRKYLLAAAVLALGGTASSHAAQITVGKSRLEIANDLRQECETDKADGLYGLGPYAKNPNMSTTQCVAAKLKELDDAIRATRPCAAYDDRPECNQP
jgi:hypothetical protein